MCKMSSTNPLLTSNDSCPVLCTTNGCGTVCMFVCSVTDFIFI